MWVYLSTRPAGHTWPSNDQLWSNHTKIIFSHFKHWVCHQLATLFIFGLAAIGWSWYIIFYDLWWSFITKYRWFLKIKSTKLPLILLPMSDPILIVPLNIYFWILWIASVVNLLTDSVHPPPLLPTTPTHPSCTESVFKTMVWVIATSPNIVRPKANYIRPVKNRAFIQCPMC